MKTRELRILPLAIVVAAAMVGCDTTGAVDSDLALSRLLNRTLSQVDRIGFPTINTAFVAAGGDKDAFNAGVPADDEAAFTATLVETIMARYGLTEAQATALADFVLPDVLPLGDLSGYPNGRALVDDVIDTNLTLIFGVFGPAVPPLQSDGVDANDVPFPGTFPYLAPPNS